ncbi:MAG: DUF2510 domain-containing protein [Acidobacteriota bacterium]
MGGGRLVLSRIGCVGGRPTEPGWYDDPAGETARQVYWDGQRWTGEARQPVARSVD